MFELETMYISLLIPKYNILTEAGSSKGYTHTNETIIKMKSLFTKERRLLLSKLQSERKGKWSEESKNKLKAIAFNRPSNYITKEGRLKKKISNVKSISINIYNIHNELICKFKNIDTARHYLCTSYKTIQRALDIGWIYIPTIFPPPTQGGEY